MQVQDHLKRIEERAYELWERAGRPEGRALEHWVQAEAEVGPAKSAKSRVRRATAVPAAAARPRRTSKVTPIRKTKTSASPEKGKTSTRT